MPAQAQQTEVVDEQKDSAMNLPIIAGNQVPIAEGPHVLVPPPGGMIDQDVTVPFVGTGAGPQGGARVGRIANCMALVSQHVTSRLNRCNMQLQLQK